MFVCTVNAFIFHYGLKESKNVSCRVYTLALLRWSLCIISTKSAYKVRVVNNRPKTLSSFELLSRELFILRLNVYQSEIRCSGSLPIMVLTILFKQSNYYPFLLNQFNYILVIWEIYRNTFHCMHALIWEILAWKPTHSNRYVYCYLQLSRYLNVNHSI